MPCSRLGPGRAACGIALVLGASAMGCGSDAVDRHRSAVAERYLDGRVRRVGDLTATASCPARATGPLECEVVYSDARTLERRGRQRWRVRLDADESAVAAARALGPRPTAEPARATASPITRLVVVPAPRTYVCVDDGKGRIRFTGIIARPHAYRGRHLRLNLGTRSAAVLVDGARVPLPPRDPVGLDIRRSGVRAIADGRRPCQ